MNIIRLIPLLLLVQLFTSRNYPVFKQCDEQWGNDKLGTSSNTICQSGSLITSIAMALSGCGKKYNPKNFNQWLIGHSGYVNKDIYVWNSIASLEFSYVGKIGNNQIEKELAVNNIVVINVRGGAHWALATGVSGTRVLVNDPGFSVTSYDLSQIVQSNNGLYRFVGFFTLPVMILDLENIFNLSKKKITQQDRHDQNRMIFK